MAANQSLPSHSLLFRKHRCSHEETSPTAIELKRKAPRAHTFLEVVKKRYGPPGHITLMCYSLIFQIFTTVNLLVGGSTLYSSMTGMNRDAACFLFPIGVLIYTLFGGTLHAFPAFISRRHLRKLIMELRTGRYQSDVSHRLGE